MDSGVTCKDLLPLMYGIICFLAAVVLFLLILLFKMFLSMQSDIKRENTHKTSDTGESTALCQNNALSFSPTSNDGADNSSSTSSDGSLPELSTGSQRYVSLEERRKNSDYINVSETASLGLVDFNNKKTDIDYVNVNESRQKKTRRKGQASCDDGTTSISSDESTLNYSKVHFLCIFQIIKHHILTGRNQICVCESLTVIKKLL
ncbi:uncharacterized protein LOC127173126 [Labeo rohita]|uniref:uncharacterized protein LOC127173126 n=1 Tax=Labeo rohita TaxID=84645 RepID=UPI0021E265C5|nr:uncharacterized protein LOC127173126 [Labeo rohita]